MKHDLLIEGICPDRLILTEDSNSAARVSTPFQDLGLTNFCKKKYLQQFRKRLLMKLKTLEKFVERIGQIKFQFLNQSNFLVPQGAQHSVILTL